MKMKENVFTEHKKQYFFDISDIVIYLSREHFYSGIQRATVMIIEQCAKSMPNHNIYISYYKARTGIYYSILYAHLPPGTLNDASKLRQFLNIRHPSRHTSYPPLSKYNGRPAKMWFHSLKFRLNSFLGNETHFRKHKSTSTEWKNSQSRPQQHNVTTNKIHFFDVAKPGDSLVLLDATWNLDSLARIFEKARHQGLNVYSLIHDLIPIIAPEYSNTDFPLKYHDWLIKTSTYTSTYLANSHCTANDLKHFLEAYGIDRAVQIIPLAQAGLPVATMNANPQRTMNPMSLDTYPKFNQCLLINHELRTVLRQPYVLCVGTMEVRKNIWKIAQVWDRLRQTSKVELPRLVFAGKTGWLTQDFRNFMLATGNLHGWIDIFEKPTDDELSFLYRNCLFTITASFYEGWGLPIGEGLSYGKTAVVSETSSMPEVGGNLVEYCNPNSIESILNACLKLIADPSHREHLEKKIAQTKLRGWNDVAFDLLATITTDVEIESSTEYITQKNDEVPSQKEVHLDAPPLKFVGLRRHQTLP